ncbi:uncharacterized protein [Elaeis guineensis]|uniref:Cyclin-dependent protein kinase inhibitor SMR2 n=1 Tax=Elaeis guineensis var. tenera TaxID=51953 RepID=A0A6I9S0D4_ELAGV|nr:cyclin-dependent protein kinase inhibitor SMR2 [Elaeis guineensis]
MSSVKLVVSEDSKPFQMDSLQILYRNSHTPSIEVEEDNNNKRIEIMEVKGEERSPAPPPPSSCSSCSSDDVGLQEEEEEKEKDQGKDAGDFGEDEGYHTPTSPRNRIPEICRCPPAPRKPPTVLYVKRKVRASQAGQLVDVGREIGSTWSAELADAGPRTKKPRREATNA